MAWKKEDEDFGDEEELKISDFNSAMFINQRLHNLWLDANNNKRKGAFSNWNGDLDAVWCELAGDVDPGTEAGRKTEEVFAELNRKIGEVSPLINWGFTAGSFNTVDPEHRHKKAKQYQALMNKEIFLRRLMNSQGKGTKYRDSIDAMLFD